MVHADVLTDEECTIIERFVAAGLFARQTDGHVERYELTVQGAALAMATANPPVKRTTAERVLAGLIERAAIVNEDPYLLMWVDRVGVFGSFLDPSVHRLGDVDCAVWLTRREVDGDRWVDASRERARPSGRHGLNHIQRLCFGETEVKRLLKARSRVLSLHYAGDDPILDQVELNRPGFGGGFEVPWVRWSRLTGCHAAVVG